MAATPWLPALSRVVMLITLGPGVRTIEALHEAAVPVVAPLPKVVVLAQVVDRSPDNPPSVADPVSTTGETLVAKFRPPFVEMDGTGALVSRMTEMESKPSSAASSSA